MSSNTSSTGANSGFSGMNEGNQQSSQTGEKQDWLDKGITGLGKKAGINISDKNADTAGDFVNKQVHNKEGRGIPGVQ